MRQHPHCDQRVLHRPGSCRVCDECAGDLQAARLRDGVAFTGEQVADTRLECPAQRARGDVCQAWEGNQPWVDMSCAGCGEATRAPGYDGGFCLACALEGR